ncbi:MAG: hypothetical protein VYA53_03170 [Acidobacteriota bacterium]|nr:hypothetical protein [Acidobacteriota bacterium]
MMIRNRLVAVSLLFFLTVSASAQETAQEELELTTRVSQTSVWPGDRIHYIITLIVSEGVKVALEDFSVENVSFEPFVLVDKQQTEEAWGERTRYVFDYLIANYEIGDKQVEIPGLIFRYETAGQETNVPTTQEKQIPVQPMSVRSTLNQPIEESWIQEELPMATTSSQTWVALLAGIVGLTVSTIPLGAWAWKQIPDWQARRRQLSRKKFLTQCSVSLDRLERRLASDNVEIKEQYQSLEELVQGYVQYFFNVQAQGLTSTELVAQLAQHDIQANEKEALAQVFERGQNCRYAPENGTEWEESFRLDLKQIKQFCT